MQKRLTLEALEDRTLLSGGSVSSTAGLIAAINAANKAGGGTAITLAPGAIFNFTSANNYTNGANALPVITADITIIGHGPNPSSGGDLLDRTAPPTMPFRLFDVASGGELWLTNLALQGGLAQGTGAAAQGGAIYSSGKQLKLNGVPQLKLNGVTVEGNTAQGSNGANGFEPNPTQSPGGSGASAHGGGLYVAGGSVSLTNSIFSSNIANGGNGGNGDSRVGTGRLACRQVSRSPSPNRTGNFYCIRLSLCRSISVFSL